MMMRQVRLGLISTALTLGGAGAALAVADSQQLVYGEITRLDGYDPYTVHEAAALRLAELLFDSLVIQESSGNYSPSLAKSWEIQDGGTAVLLTLRDDVKWHHPGGETARKLTADDVVATVRLLTAQASEIPNRERFQVLRAAERVDETHVTVRYHRALTDPLRPLMLRVLPAHVLGAATSLKRDSEFARQPVGTGPYQFVKANSQGEVLLAANPEYFKGKPSIERVVMKSYSDQSVMAQSLMFDSLDLITYVSPRDLGEVIGDSRLNVVPYDALSYSFLALNTERGPLKDKRFRQAIGYAINRPEMMTAFFQGQGRLVSGPFPPTSWAYNLDVKPLAFAPDRAKTLISSVVGQGSAPARPLVFAVPVQGESEMVKRVVLAVQGYLESVGVKVELKFMDWLVWKKTVLEDHDYDITIASWSFDDSSNVTSLFHSSAARPWGNNFVMYRNVEVDSLLTEADATNDAEKRRAIYQKLHAVLAEECPYVYLWSLTHHAAHGSQLSGLRVEPFSFFKNVAQWRLEPGNAKK